jgi:hypothetical protein
MYKTVTRGIFVCTLLAALAAPALAGINDGLVAYFKLDETSGTFAADSSGNGNHGTLIGTDLAWAPGYDEGALAISPPATGDVAERLEFPTTGMSAAAGTVCVWGYLANPQPASSGRYFFGHTTQPQWNSRIQIYTQDGTNPSTRLDIGLGASHTAGTDVVDLPMEEWLHVALTWDNGRYVAYVNGEQVSSGSYSGLTAIHPIANFGNDASSGPYEAFSGMLDEARVYNRALSAAEVKTIALMQPLGRFRAKDPTPADKGTDVPVDAVLGWTASAFAGAHDVYLGTTFDDVNDAGRDNPGAFLVGQAQADTGFDPAGLEYGTTYYWRIDEVNATPDRAIFQGVVWSFTTEPYGYPITGVTATASSAQANMGPQNTVNGSGLNANDEHSTELTEMWMSAGALPNWVQYEFDRVYKLDSLLVWNSNQMIEAFVGFGARDVTIEYSEDGETWAALDGVPEFTRATGQPTYQANTRVEFGGALAKFVKLTINQNWGGVAPQTGLSEVRFFYVPVQAFGPEPADGATDVLVDADLIWRAGREAESHEVYLGADEAALALADTVAEGRYTPASLDFGTTYFWKVDEVGGEGPYAGEVWSFTTQEYAVVEDFESYNDDDNRIYDAWIDGLTDAAKGGSQVGYDVSPFAEKLVVHGGKQSMPLMYDNSASPFISEAERTFDTPQNWTVHGADTLSLYVSGSTPAFAETAAGTVFMNAIGADIWNNADQFRYAYKTLNGNGTMVARVESIFNSNVWAKGGVMIRQSIEPGSTHAFMPITPGGSGAGNGASFQHRLTANGASTNNDNTTPVVAAPYWVKIERNGNSFTGAISPDGQTWKQLGGAQTITMTGPVLIGLALCSHDAAIATAAEFSNIAFTGNVSGNWQVAEIGVAQPTGNSVEGLYVTLKDSSGKSATVMNPDTAATVRSGWQQWKIPLSEFTAAGVKVNAVKSMTIGVGNKTSPTAGGAGTLFIDDIGFGRPLP